MIRPTSKGKRHPAELLEMKKSRRGAFGHCNQYRSMHSQIHMLTLHLSLTKLPPFQRVNASAYELCLGPTQAPLQIAIPPQCVSMQAPCGGGGGTPASGPPGSPWAGAARCAGCPEPGWSRWQRGVSGRAQGGWLPAGSAGLRPAGDGFKGARLGGELRIVICSGHSLSYQVRVVNCRMSIAS